MKKNETFISHGKDISTNEAIHLIEKATRIWGPDAVGRLGVEVIEREAFARFMNKKYGTAAAQPPIEQPGRWEPQITQWPITTMAYGNY